MYMLIYVQTSKTHAQVQTFVIRYAGLYRSVQLIRYEKLTDIQTDLNSLLPIIVIIIQKKL